MTSSRATPRSASTKAEVPLVADGRARPVHPAASSWRPAPPRPTPSSPATTCPGCGSGAAPRGMAGVHGVRPGERAVVVVRHRGSARAPRTLRAAGIRIAAVAAPAALAERLPDGVGEVVIDGVRAEAARRQGRSTSVVLRRGEPRRSASRATRWCSRSGSRRATRCARMAAARVEPVDAWPGDAGAGPPTSGTPRPNGRPTARRVPVRGRCRPRPRAGVGRGVPHRRDPEALHDRDDGSVPGRDVRPRSSSCFVRGRARVGRRRRAGARTTARPPARPVDAGDLAAGVHEVDREAHVAPRSAPGAGRPDGRPAAGSGRSPTATGATEYRAVRERVSLMDVGTLGKFLVAGPDADA